MEKNFVSLKNYFDPFIKTSNEDWEYLTRSVRFEEIPSRTLIKASGEEELHLRFILSGAAAMLLNKGNKDLCFDLCYENDFLCDFASFNEGAPSNISIRSFEPISMLVIDKPLLLAQYNESALASQLGRIMIEQESLKKQKMYTSFMGKNSIERYQILMTTRPNILLRTPQNYIASYLGVSPERLSRIRKALN